MPRFEIKYAIQLNVASYRWSIMLPWSCLVVFSTCDQEVAGGSLPQRSASFPVSYPIIRMRRGLYDRNKKIGSHLCALRVADPLFTPLIAARRCSLERKKKHSGGNTPCGAPPAPSLAATADGRPWPAPPPRAGLTHHGRAPAPNVPGWRTGGRPTCRAGRLSLQLPPTLSLSRLGGGGCRPSFTNVAR